jgi:hypothetical protein
VWDGFYEDLARDPENWQLRSVMADWCEDNDQPALAECLRWMVQHRKRPYSGASSTWTWFNADTVDAEQLDPESDIPDRVFRHLTGQEAAHHKSYPSLRRAEEDFQAAWLAARQTEREPRTTG